MVRNDANGDSGSKGHLLFNSSQATAQYLQENAGMLVRGKDVLELGAGAGLPGIVCGIEGARRVGVLLSHLPIPNCRFEGDV